MLKSFPFVSSNVFNVPSYPFSCETIKTAERSPETICLSINVTNLAQTNAVFLGNSPLCKWTGLKSRPLASLIRELQIFFIFGDAFQDLDIRNDEILLLQISSSNARVEAYTWAIISPSLHQPKNRWIRGLFPEDAIPWKPSYFMALHSPLCNW